MNEQIIEKLKLAIGKIRDFVEENTKLSIILLGVLGVILIFTDYSGSEDDSRPSKEIAPVTSEVNQKPRENIPPVAPPAPAPRINYANEFPVSLGNVKIGHSVEEIRTILGKEDQISKGETVGHEHHKYKDIVVTTNANEGVVGLVTYTQKSHTEKNLHQGSSLQDVFSAYGRNCSVSKFEDLTLYEYPFTSAQNNTVVLRFAVKNNLVDYISLRRVQGAERDDIISSVEYVNDEKTSTSFVESPTREPVTVDRGIGLTLDQFVTRYNAAISPYTFNGAGQITYARFNDGLSGSIQLTNHLGFVWTRASMNTDEIFQMLLIVSRMSSIPHDEDVVLREMMKAMIAVFEPDIDTNAFISGMISKFPSESVVKMNGRVFTFGVVPEKDLLFYMIVSEESYEKNK